MNRSLASKKKKKVFYPKEFLKKVLPRFFGKKALNKIDVKRQTLRAITTSKAINGRKIKASIYRTIAEYERKYRGQSPEGHSPGGQRPGGHSPGGQRPGSLIGFEDLSKSRAYGEIGDTVPRATGSRVNDPRDTVPNKEALLKQRIENAVVYDEVQELKEEHEGESYRWLPSDSKIPRPHHQLLYGKIFKVGHGDSNGNMPGEDYGCRCGIEFLGEEK